MATIALQTWGSEGDIRPFATLARGLSDRGHRVVLAVTDPSGRQVPEVAGVERIDVGPELALSAEESDALMRRCFAAGSPLEQGSILLERTFFPFVPAMFAAARELATSADLFVRHYFLFFCQAAAEARGIPEIALHLSPDTLPTRERAATGFPVAGRFLNGLSWRMVDSVTARIFGAHVENCRRELGLGSVKSVLREVWQSRTANLVTASPALCPRPRDWPVSVAVTGFLPSDALDAPPNDAILAFLHEGTAPVFAGFGSLFPRQENEREPLIDLLAETAERASVRMLVQGGVDERVGANVLSFARCSHAALLPHCAGAIHHAGAGTTHAVLAAAVPSVTVPHLADQFFWAAHLARRGLGAAPVPRRKLSAERLVDALAEVLGDAQVHRRLAELQSAMRGEQGVDRAVRVIEDVLGRAG